MTTLTIPRQHYEEVATLLKSKFEVVATEECPPCSDVIKVRGELILLLRSEDANHGPVILAT